MYPKSILKHFKTPQNTGEIADADTIGEMRDPNNGNVVKIWIKLGCGVIEEIKFKASGCVPLIASGSVVTSLAKGKTVAEAMKINLADVLEELKGLPSEKIHTSILTLNTLKKSLSNINIIQT